MQNKGRHALLSAARTPCHKADICMHDDCVASFALHATAAAAATAQPVPVQQVVSVSTLSPKHLLVGKFLHRLPLSLDITQ